VVVGCADHALYSFDIQDALKGSGKPRIRKYYGKKCGIYPSVINPSLMNPSVKNVPDFNIPVINPSVLNPSVTNPPSIHPS
jgi:hypothetical protein